jgi:hypothetical protein
VLDGTYNTLLQTVLIITETACLEAALLKQNTAYSKFGTELCLFQGKSKAKFVIEVDIPSITQQIIVSK